MCSHCGGEVTEQDQIKRVEAENSDKGGNFLPECSDCSDKDWIGLRNKLGKRKKQREDRREKIAAQEAKLKKRKLEKEKRAKEKSKRVQKKNAAKKQASKKKAAKTKKSEGHGNAYHFLKYQLKE